MAPLFDLCISWLPQKVGSLNLVPHDLQSLQSLAQAVRAVSAIGGFRGAPRDQEGRANQSAGGGAQ